MNVPQFSMVIAVHPGTVHRRESEGATLVSVDGVAAGVLAALDQKVDHNHPQSKEFKPDEVGQQVVQALIVGGALFALGFLITELVGKGKR